MMEHESEVNSVLGRLETAGAVQECENHGYPIDQDDSEAVEEEKAVRLVEDAMSQTCRERPGCVKNDEDD